MAEATKPYENPYQDNESVRDWASKQLSAKRPFLLAHTDDGVIWGRYTADGLQTSHQFAPEISPPLQVNTLQQLSIFGKHDEIRLFSNELDQWTTVQIVDPADTNKFLIENQRLIGNGIRGHYGNNFTHLFDKVQQGLDHIVPRIITEDELEKHWAAALKIHHILQQDEDTGEVRIHFSRLVQVIKTDDAGKEVTT